ncbi:putative beta-1 3-galactosyltransferase 14 [Bienertia sinuspersici]
MPSSKGPKIFHQRSSSPFSKPIIKIFFLLLGFSLLIFVLVAISRSLFDQNCNSIQPKTVSVVWERTDVSSGGISGDSLVSSDSKKRHKVMGFVGIFTGFGSIGRRRSLRQTWFPSDRDGLQRLEEATGLAFRFIIGKTGAEWKMSVLRKEVSKYDDFILLDIVEEYSKLPYKTLAFFKAAYALFDSEFYVKADDDIYLRPVIYLSKLTDRLSLLLAKERSDPQTYLGCMKKGPVFTSMNPCPICSAQNTFSMLMDQFMHFLPKSFRMFSNEDVTIGAWMLAMNVNHENNLELCARECTSTSIAVWDIPKCSDVEGRF